MSNAINSKIGQLLNVYEQNERWVEYFKVILNQPNTTARFDLDKELKSEVLKIIEDQIYEQEGTQ